MNPANTVGLLLALGIALFLGAALLFAEKF